MQQSHSLCEARPASRQAGFVSPIVIKCATCCTTGRSANICQTVFQWENEHLELPWAGGDAIRLSIFDVGGMEHVVESFGMPLCGEDSFRNWRARFLRRLLGPRPRAQNQVMTQVGAARPQFQWTDNFHLMSDDLNYLDGADVRRLRILDTSGTWHELLFGRGMEVIPGVKDTVAYSPPGGKGFVLKDDDADVFETVILAYRQAHDAALPLREHMNRLQQDLSFRIRHFSLQLNMCGHNFPDFLLSLVTSGKHPAITAAF
ncbi:hypothetical protein CHU98_g9396 [Xylaria longipes]|nr:hypothetical protein CHU98_g9396 [Xylaria longipes]